MPRALVVYESMFGNTEKVARAVAAGLSERVTVEVRRAGPDTVVDEDVELLVVGGPTHAFGLTRPRTRVSAGQQGAPAAVADGPGIREWLSELPPTTCAVATFDTRIRKTGVPGSAACGAERRLGRGGARILAPATSFWVGSTDGPLLVGEEDRARRWGRQLAALLTVRHGVRR
ncbi:MAG TPA: flavodoxin [Actinomycetes bacterium]